jgi:AraC-like DNA-binding protein
MNLENTRLPPYILATGTISSRRPRSQLRLPIVRRAHLKPYVDFLSKIGAPTDRYLQRAKLPIQHQPAAEYMSNRGYFEFVGIAAREEGIPDLGYQSCMHVGRTRLSPELVRRMDRSPTLYGALKGFCRDIHKDASHIQVGLVEEPDRVLFWQRSATEAGPVGWDISEQLVTSMVIDIVRHFAGRHWFPKTIRVRSPFVPNECREHLPTTPLLGGGQALIVPIPRSVLHLPPRCGRAMSGAAPGALTYPDDLPSALREVLKGYVRDGSACLELAADLVDTSPRTLQRRLSEIGTSFASVLAQARYQVAAHLLADPKRQIIDVAYAAGYSDPSNFSRAFRRIAGLSPTEYRDSLVGVK